MQCFNMVNDLNLTTTGQYINDSARTDNRIRCTACN